MSFTEDWDETTPLDTDLIKDGAGEIRKAKINLRERIALEHYFDPAEEDSLYHGSHKFPITSKSATYTLLYTDRVLLATTTSAWTLSLPTAVGFTSFVFFIKKISADYNALTIDPSGSETIDDASTLDLTLPNEGVFIISTGTGWKILGKTMPSAYKGALVKRTSNQSLANITWTPIAWESAVYDTNVLWDVGSADRLTVPTGFTKAKASVHLEFSPIAVGLGYALRLYQYSSGGAILWWSEIAFPALSNAFKATISMSSPTLVVAAGQYFSVSGYQASGGALDVVASSSRFELKLDVT